jgi:hypothetical protein
MTNETTNGNAAPRLAAKGQRPVLASWALLLAV